MMKISLAGLLLAGATISAADWPQFLGPDRNGSSPETGLLAGWADKKPKVIWKVPGGGGYSQIAVAGDRAYTSVQRGQDEVILALDAVTGKEAWSKRLGIVKNKTGPSTTPSVVGGRVYVQSTNGPLLCLEADNGKVVWQRDLLQEFKGGNTPWGMTVSPLIEGDLVLTVSGGAGAGVIALNKATGKLVWKSTNDALGYASPVVMKVGDEKQALFLNNEGIVAVKLDDGKERWRFPWPGESDVNSATPLVVGNRLLLAASDAGVLLEPVVSGEPKKVWGPMAAMNTYWATAVSHDGRLYGICDEHLQCVEAATGKLVWSQKNFGTGDLTLADGNLYILTIAGDLVVAPATPKGYQEKGRTKSLQPVRFINSPTIAGKRLFARDLKNIICVDIGGN
jgi:outer membrane protein assembly factor BamB